jgi:hypothetical protein
MGCIGFIDKILSMGASGIRVISIKLLGKVSTHVILKDIETDLGVIGINLGLTIFDLLR